MSPTLQVRTNIETTTRKRGTFARLLLVRFFPGKRVPHHELLRNLRQEFGCQVEVTVDGRGRTADARSSPFEHISQRVAQMFVLQTFVSSFQETHHLILETSVWLLHLAASQMTPLRRL